MIKECDDIRSKKFVFVPFCLLSQAFQAGGIVKKWSSSVSEILNLLESKNVNIIQMPCPESYFKDFSNLRREPHGLKYYNNDEYVQHCKNLSLYVFKMIDSIISANYEVCCIIGVENSPSCTIETIYTNKGTIRRKGLFIEELYKLLVEAKYDIKLIPFYRKNVEKTIDLLERIFE